MKVYGGVPNGFMTVQRLDENEKISSEILYYKMEYIPFYSKMWKHDFNTMNCKDLQGKYFYLFAEDTIFEGNKLINNYHRLKADTCLILEYDIPEDIILKHIGYGDYTYDIRTLLLMETFIEKCDFGNNVILSSKIDKIKSRKFSLKLLKIH